MYRCWQKTKEMLEYIHGEDKGALFGAWDFLDSFAFKETINWFQVTNRGQYLQGVRGKAVKDFNNSEEALKQAVAIKFQNYLSRRKFYLVCKTQSSVYDAEQIALPKVVSDLKVDHFMKSLYSGRICQILIKLSRSIMRSHRIGFYDSGLAFVIPSFTKNN